MKRPGRSKEILGAALLSIVITFAVTFYAINRPAANSAKSSTDHTSMSTSIPSSIGTYVSIQPSSLSSSSLSDKSSSSSNSLAVVARVEQFRVALASLPESVKHPGIEFPNASSVKAIDDFYSNSSLITWSGLSENLFACCSKVNNLTLAYSVLARDTNYSQVTLSNLTWVETTPDMVNTSFLLTLSGSQLGFALTSACVGDGPFSLIIEVQQQWVNQGGIWTIQRESWNWLKFSPQTFSYCK